MEITNAHDLPQGMMDALTAGIYKPEPFVYRVTELIAPPRIRFLRMRNWDNLREDASERLWALLGQSVHHFFQKTATTGLAEETVMLKFMGANNLMATIRGTADVLDGDTINDYKVTSVWSVKDGVKPEWEWQLNMYAHLFGLLGTKVDKLFIHAILRDFMNSRKAYDSQPEIPFVTLPVKRLSDSVMRSYITERLVLFTELDNDPSLPLPVCSDEERWARPDQYAVMKAGASRALKLFPFDQLDEAESYACQKGAHVELRKGESVRCQSYCAVADHCDYHQKNKTIGG